MISKETKTLVEQLLASLPETARYFVGKDLEKVLNELDISSSQCVLQEVFEGYSEAEQIINDIGSLRAEEVTKVSTWREEAEREVKAMAAISSLRDDLANSLVSNCACKSFTHRGST